MGRSLGLLDPAVATAKAKPPTVKKGRPKPPTPYSRDPRAGPVSNQMVNAMVINPNPDLI